jgi:hypothetical protein
MQHSLVNLDDDSRTNSVFTNYYDQAYHGGVSMRTVTLNEDIKHGNMLSAMV